MVLILYFYKNSPPSRSVHLLLREMELQAEIKVVNLRNLEQKKPEYMKINPLGQVPAIDDDGFTLWESHAIMTYLVSKYGKDDSLYPRDLKKRAIVDQRLHYSNDVFQVLLSAVNRTLYLNEPPNPDLIEKAKEAQANMEKLLEGQQFMAGDSLTVADFSYVTLMDALEFISPTHGKFTLIKAWLDRCKSTMKDFEKINKEGAEQLLELLKSSSKK